ncbi:hypothetical protein Clacol_006759 [Clathrus columnatus]|uniref:Uncharacterized protein n=1 Tax=Clathrus columnatus TaxID=1419009 RepID=A0AAV5AJ63_9AGAM|nr:hypothetical protein Clacol_006759 [Clathrus columnatus]
MDTRSAYEHGSEISVLRACRHSDGADLIAIGGKHSVEVIQVVKLATAGEDLNLRLLTRFYDDESDYIFVFGGGLSGHRNLINDLTWCGGYGEESSRFLASVSDEKILLLWDLSVPTEGTSPNFLSDYKNPSQRPQPIPFAISYAHPLHSIVSHPSTSKELVVSDSQGSVFVVDWRYDPADEHPEDRYRGLSIAQLIDPRALADARTGMQTVWGGSVDWHPEDANIIGAAFGSRWAIWNIRNSQGGKPISTGKAFEHGTCRFRWCPTTPDLFGVIPSSPIEDAVVNIYNASYIRSMPRRHVIRNRPHRITDFDWLNIPPPANPRFVVAIGRKVILIEVGPEDLSNI